MPQANHYGNDAFIVSAQLYGNDATVYARSGYTLKYQQTLVNDISAPQGDFATQNDYLYLSNSGRSNILVYKIRNKKPFPQYPTNTLDDYGQIPVNVSATPSRNLVAVSNYAALTGGAGSVSVYLNRDSEPSRVLTYGTDQLQGEGIAIDHQGNCFWSFNDPNTNGGSIVEFAGCNGSGSVVQPGLTKAEGVVFDQSGNMYYVDQTQGVFKCVKTSSCYLWAPNATYGFGLPTNINFDYKAKALWLADATGYIWSIELKGGKCTEPKKHGGLCVRQYPSQDGDPFGVAPIRGE